jgi:hypothetical protein
MVAARMTEKRKKKKKTVPKETEKKKYAEGWKWQEVKDRNIHRIRD